MKKTISSLICCIVLLLGGCAGTQTQYYQLPDSGLSVQANTGRVVALTVNMPDYLNGTAMVYQQDDVTLNFSQQNLWAQSLKISLEQSLTNKLNKHFSSPRFVQYTSAQGRPKHTLAVTINRFYGRYDGQVSVSGFFQLLDENNRTIKSESFHYTVAQHGDGYAPMVRALDSGLEQVADLIASHFN